MKKAIVIGAGISGLSTGIHLLNKGYEVEIFEKNHTAGGFLTSWVRKGSIIDGCIHWLLGTKDGSDVNKVWRTVGAIDDNTKFLKTTSFYEVKYNNDTLRFYNDIDLLEKELLKYSLYDEKEIGEMIETMKWIKDNGPLEMPTDKPMELKTMEELKPSREFFRHTIKYQKMNLEDFSELFNSEIIKFALLNSPVNKYYNAFYFLQTLVNLSIGNDSIPYGGSHNFRDRMVNKFISLGGKLHLNSIIKRINLKDERAVSISTSDNEYNADYIVSSADMHHTYNDLLSIDDHTFTNYDKEPNRERYSFIIFSYRTKHDFKDDEVSTVFKTKYNLMNKEYDSLHIRHYQYDDSLINDGYTTIQVMITTYKDDYYYLKSLSKAEYKALKNEMAKVIEKKLVEIYNDSFELIDSLTPLTYERYNNSFEGTFMGYILGKKMNSYTESFRSKIKNLYFSNQWMFTPGGTPVAVVNGKLVADLIEFDDNNE